MSFTSWIDQQIAEAQERGAFDNLAGAGKPLPKRRHDEDAGQAWLRDYVQREGVAPEELLPEPLKLCRQLELLTQTVAELRSEEQVRAAAAELNERIAKWQRLPVGPPIFVPLANEDDLVAAWRTAHPEPEPDDQPAQAGGLARRRWRISGRPPRSHGSR